MIDKFYAYLDKTELLDGQVVLVTGASKGIGRALATACARCGARVVLHGRDVKALEKIHDEITALERESASIIPLDLATITWKDCAAFAAAIEREIGQLDAVVHNAGILGPRTPIEQYPEDAWQNVLQINLTAPFLLTRACIPLLKKSENASIILTSSGVGRKGRAYWGAYAVSKFGTEGLMEILADELENVGSIRVNCINPGATRTSMRRLAYPGEDPMTLKTADEIIGVWLYLLSNESSAITGQSLDAQPG